MTPADRLEIQRLWNSVNQLQQQVNRRFSPLNMYNQLVLDADGRVVTAVNPDTGLAEVVLVPTGVN
jgi:capsid portal protein